MQRQDLLVYFFIYLFLPIVSIYKINKRENSELYLNIDVTNSLRGLAIIMIIVHHIIQKNTDFILLLPFLNFGCIGVSVFLLLSGYGLTTSYKNKKTNLEDYKKARLMIILTFIYIVIANIIKLEPYWYNTAIFFPLGVLLVEYKEKILNLLKKYSTLLLISSILIFLGIVIFRFMFGDMGKTQIMDIVAMIIFNILILSMCYIFNINSIFLKFMGKISLELYLIHIILLSEMTTWHINNIYNYVLFFMIVITLSFILNKIQKEIKSIKILG